jgi:hypothetical protein
MAAGGEPPKPIRLFYSYSHKDEELRLKLQDHLAVLRWNGMIAEWHDRDIEAGAEWAKEIDRHLSEADIILLLISASFIASPYCWSVEVTKALERHARGEARVIPVILRPCRWKSTPFAQLQATPKDATPVTLWSDTDAAFDDVASKIEAVVRELQGKPAPEPVVDAAKPSPPVSQGLPMVIRIFLSSPGDVAEERTLARQFVDSELPRMPYFRKAKFELISWDNPAAWIPMLATETPQDSVNAARPRPANCDIVIVILWSRMGTPLPDNVRKPDGAPYLSGTEWEYEDAVKELAGVVETGSGVL